VEKAKAITAELIARAEEHQSIGYLAEAENWFAYTMMVSGNFELADQAFQRAWPRLESMVKPVAGRPSKYADHTSQDWKLIQNGGAQQNNRVLSGWNLWFLGYPDRALQRLGIATAIAHTGPKSMLADIHGFASYIYELRREPEQMREKAEARLGLATESGMFTGRVLSEIYLGWADALAGDLEGGVARMQHHMLELKAASSEYISDRYLTFVASALGRMGRFDEGLSTIDESFPFIERSGQRYYEAELHRLKGELLLAQNVSNAAQAEKSFRIAIDIARKQRAKSWELRATTSLSRLMRDTDRRDEARTMLAEIYGWFTEGFDTPDLKDAKALLQELGG
jgi:tetratricopeptide (TPR) repeat protein